MFKIKSADQRAKTFKQIQRFNKDLENIRRRKGDRAAASFEKMYRSHMCEFHDQIVAYDSLRKDGLPPLNESDLTKIGSYLVDARIAAGLTQKELAARLGVSQPMVFKYENAEYAGCGTDVMEKVIEALGLDLDIGLRRGARRSARFAGFSLRRAGDQYFRNHFMGGIHA